MRENSSTIAVKNLGNNQSDIFWENVKILDTRLMLNKLIRINKELFNEIRKCARGNGVPLTLSSSILRLANEIQKTDVECFPPDESSQGDKPNDKFSVP